MIPKISICICTRNRFEGLRSLLTSLEEMNRPDDREIFVIIVENDEVKKSENIVNEFSSKKILKIFYFLETKLGISYARNRSVKEAEGSDFYCFIDDDQTVHKNWLVELVKCQEEFDSDGVWGPNPPVFDRKVKPYVDHFYQPEIFEYGTIVGKAHTNCLMLSSKCINKIDGPFDLRLNFSGGEDSLLTFMISKHGGIIRYNPYAIAYEQVPENRTPIKYILKRTYRISNAGFIYRYISGENKKKRIELTRLTLRLGLGVLILIPYLIFGGKNKLLGLIKISNAFGGYNYYLGQRSQFYKQKY